MKDRELEVIKSEWNRILYIKNIVYGFNVIPNSSATEFWDDYYRIQRKYNDILKDSKRK